MASRRARPKTLFPTTISNGRRLQKTDLRQAPRPARPVPAQRTQHDRCLTGIGRCSRQDRGPEDFQERESSESPMLNAFCRVAPSVLFSFLAILEAGVFLFAIDFSSRTSVEVHARRFFVLLAIEPSFQIKASCIPCGSGGKVILLNPNHPATHHTYASQMHLLGPP